MLGYQMGLVFEGIWWPEQQLTDHSFPTGICLGNGQVPEGLELTSAREL